MNYGKFTQGTIVDGIRSDKYPYYPCKAVVISARCDISQCKVSKFYYLTATDVTTWLKTEGLLDAAEKKFIKQFEIIAKQYYDKIPGLSKWENASVVDLNRIYSDISKLPENVDTKLFTKELDEIKKYYVGDCIAKEQLEGLTELRSAAFEQLSNVIDDKIAKFFFIPQLAYCTEAERKKPDYSQVHHDGIIVNLLDVNYWSAETISKIERQELDYNKLSPSEREEFNHTFFIQQIGDMIFPEREIASPYLERLMQTFSSAFSRIGLANDREAAKKYWRDKKKEK